MQFKFLNLNVWIGGKLMEPLLAFLKEQNADIMTFQEIYSSSDESLNPRFRTFEYFKTQFPEYQWANFAPAFYHILNDEKHLMGNAVFSKYPITSSNITFYDRPFGEADERQGQERKTFQFFPRNLQHVAIDAGGTPLNICNTHGIWGEDGEDNPRRLAMTETILKTIRGKSKVILTGDFNVNDYTESIKNIEKHLTNIFKGERTTSFNMRRKGNGGYATAVVDNIFISSDMSVTSHGSPDVDISDHFPLLATFSF